MAINPTYPGVYVQEIPSGVRTVAGVSTSVTGIVGRYLRGPVNEPVTCFSFGEFNRRFGGLSLKAPASYAVDDFYANGGSQALIVRLFKPKANSTGVATITVGGNLDLSAVSPGEWGNKLRARVTYPDQKSAETYIKSRPNLGLADGDLFELLVEDLGTGARETFRNVAVKDGGSRRIDRVLAAESNLVRVTVDNNGVPTLPNGRPVAQSNFDTAQDGDDGDPLVDTDYVGDSVKKTGINALLKADIFNLLVIPPDERYGTIPANVWEAAAKFCFERRAFLIVDPPADWDSNPETAVSKAVTATTNQLFSLTNGSNAGLFFPRILRRDQLREGQLDLFAPGGAIAGIMARTDVARGVWKAPAGIEASVAGAEGLTVKLTDDENGQLNPIAVNCLRTFPNIGRVVWGSRTMRGSDLLSDDYKYIPVRRLALFLEESLYRGTQWVVFSPNDEPLWSQIRLNVGSFMQRLFRQGAFKGASPRDAYFVKCDGETTTADDINRGIVNIAVGFAPLFPAEFVVINIQQIREAAA